MEGKLKLLDGAPRAFFAAAIACALFLSIPKASAQEGLDFPGADPAADTEAAVDPITAIEMTFVLDDPLPEMTVNQIGARDFIQMLLTLALVAAAIYGLVFLIKRGARGNAAKDPFLKILARAPLGVNRSAYVLSVGTQAWLVGAAENGVHLIAEITDKETLDTMLLEESRNASRLAPGRFPDFKSLLGRFGANTDPGAPPPDNIRQRRDRLKGL